MSGRLKSRTHLGRGEFRQHPGIINKCCDALGRPAPLQLRTAPRFLVALIGQRQHDSDARMKVQSLAIVQKLGREDPQQGDVMSAHALH